MRGRSIIAIISAALIVGSCGVPKNKFRLNGKMKNIRSADIFIYSEQGYDTLHIRNGKFEYERELTEPEILTIQYPDFTQRKIVAEPGVKAKFTTDAADLADTKVTGSQENEILAQFYRDTESRHDKQSLAAEFVNAHPKTLAAQAVFETFLLDAKDIDGPTVKRLLALLLKNQPHNAQLSSLAGKINPMLATLPGAKIPDFKVKTYDGNEISPATFKGKYVLISFWATWQYDSYQQMRGLKYTIRPFKDKVSMVNVCLDYDARSFRNTIIRDTLPGHNICDTRSWDSPLVKAFGVSYVPGNVLVSPEGKILMRDIKSNDLRARLSKYLKP